MKRIEISSEALARFRAAASEFAHQAKPHGSRLLSVREDIAALRAKGASFRTISRLLTRSGISASDTSVLQFCQRVLGENPARGSKAKLRAAPAKNPRTVGPATSHAAPAPTPAARPQPSEAAQVALLDDLLSFRPEQLAKPPTQGGPRIAKIEFANPDKPDKS